MPSTIRSHGDRIIAPGAESVGQAQIVTGFSKPFALDGLFGDADHSAFDAGVEETEDSAMIAEREEPMEEGAPNRDV